MDARTWNCICSDGQCFLKCVQCVEHQKLDHIGSCCQSQIHGFGTSFENMMNAPRDPHMNAIKTKNQGD